MTVIAIWVSQVSNCILFIVSQNVSRYYSTYIGVYSSMMFSLSSVPASVGKPLCIGHMINDLNKWLNGVTRSKWFPLILHSSMWSLSTGVAMVNWNTGDYTSACFLVYNVAISMMKPIQPYCTHRLVGLENKRKCKFLLVYQRCLVCWLSYNVQ